MNIQKNKKGDGLSLNVIVIAVLAILVLAVLSYILFRGTTDFNDGAATCPGGDDMCVINSDYCDGAAVPRSCNQANGDTGNYCCVGGLS